MAIAASTPYRIGKRMTGNILGQAFFLLAVAAFLLAAFLALTGPQ